MADVLSPEVQVRAMMLESGPPPAPIQPIVDSLRKSLDEDSAKAALRLAANTDVNQAKINFAINENIGIERNPDGTKNITTGSSEETRKTQATTIGDILGNIAEKGYDQLTLAQKDTAQTAVLDLLKSYPAFQNVMSGPPPRAAMTNAEKKAYVDRILSDPSHREQTIKKLSELTDVTNVNTDSVMQLQKEFSDIDDEISIMDGELTDVVTRITQIEDRLKEFQPEIVIDPTTTPPTTREGGTFRTITELAGQVGTHRIDQKNKTTDLAIKISKIAGYQRQLRVGGLNITQVTTITDAITVAEGLIAGLKTDIEDLNRQIDEKIAKKDALSRQEAE